MDGTSNEGLENLVELVTERLNEITQNGCGELMGLWTELWKPSERENRVGILVDHCAEELRTLFERVINKEKATKEEYISRVEKLLDEIATLQLELQVVIPYIDVESLPLHCMAFRLNEKAERYRVIRNERLRKWQELTDREKELAEMLGSVTCGVEDVGVPTEQQINTLANTVAAMEAEKLERTMVFMERRDRMQELFMQLGETAMFAFEKEVLHDESASNFKVTVENMCKLNALVEKLERKVSDAIERRDNIVSQLRSLWEYLEEPKERQEALLADHSEVNLSCLEALQKELDRCKAEKSANIGRFVERIRVELQNEWDKCFVSQEKRDEFRLFHISTFSEDVYNFHEAELNRWKQYHEKNEKIFELYARHKVLLQKLAELDGRERNTGRFQNRGGQLLQEERERKLVVKELPRVESELKAVLRQYQDNNREPFLCFGTPLEKVLDEEWEAQFDQKVIDRYRDGGSTRKAVRTPLATKRGAVVTPASCSTEPKISRLMTQKSTLGPNTRVRVKLYPTEDQNNVVEPSYEEFQRTLNKKVLCSKTVSRSTEVLTPSRLLQEQNTPVMKSTPSIAVSKWTVPEKTPKTVPRAAKRPVVSKHTPLKKKI